MILEDLIFGFLGKMFRAIWYLSSTLLSLAFPGVSYALRHEDGNSGMVSSNEETHLHIQTGKPNPGVDRIQGKL